MAFLEREAMVIIAESEVSMPCLNRYLGAEKSAIKEAARRTASILKAAGDSKDIIDDALNSLYKSLYRSEKAMQVLENSSDQ